MNYKILRTNITGYYILFTILELLREIRHNFGYRFAV